MRLNNNINSDPDFFRIQVLHCARANLSGPNSPLTFVSEKLEVTCKTLLTNHFTFIFPHFVIYSRNTAEYQKCCKFFEREAKLEVNEVIKKFVETKKLEAIINVGNVLRLPIRQF